MTARQKFMKLFYPFTLLIGKMLGKNNLVKKNNVPAKTSFPVETILLSDERSLTEKDIAGKKLLIVNTASDCGYTAQYGELQQLQQKFDNKLLIVGFPANDFKEQETKADDEIGNFCQKNFGVSFPLSKKASVIKSTQQHPAFHWLSNREENGWNEQAPHWNFCKYLLDEDQNLIGFFEPGIVPSDPKLSNMI